MTADSVLKVEDLAKTLTLHTQGGMRIPVFAGVAFTVALVDYLPLVGPAGGGKSTLLRLLYADYLPDSGHIWVKHGGGWVDTVSAEPRELLAVRA